MNAFFALIVTLFVASSLAAQNVKYTNFPERGADIIIHPKEHTRDDSMIVLIGESFSTTSLEKIEDINVAPLISHTMGLMAMGTSSNKQGFPQVSLFDYPKVNLLFTVDGVGSDFLSQNPSTASFKDKITLPLFTSTFPASTLTSLTSISTGTSPSEHGIVGDSWITYDNKNVAPHSSFETSSVSANFADVLSQISQGKSLTLSGSANPNMAATFAPHNIIKQSFPTANTFTCTLSNSCVSEGELTDEKVRKAVTEQSFLAFIGVSSLYNEDGTPIFDLDSKNVDNTLVSELYLLYSLSNGISKDESLVTLVNDEVPDSITFTFSSLRALAQKYGTTSAKYILAVQLVESAISNTISQISSVYNGRTISEVIFLDPAVNTPDSQNIKNTVLGIVEAGLQVRELYDIHYPRVYLEPSLSMQDHETICALLRDVLQFFADVHCSSRATGAPKYVEDMTFRYNLDAPNNGSCPIIYIQDNDFVAAQQIAMWTFLIFFILCCIGVYSAVALGNDITKDTLLFRSPGRHQHQN
eukprot:TRINITY_DN4049_c0_g3_i1.p1 TRINITY_DN4049_c0_g3~~TRINITY_DN4049_c0_g3_i1.p1  ORF type:complete len:528 (+),score=127.32 TRINITY_DN4049_c0_g3_i1:1403-2986(+)